MRHTARNKGRRGESQQDKEDERGMREGGGSHMRKRNEEALGREESSRGPMTTATVLASFLPACLRTPASADSRFLSSSLPRPVLLLLLFLLHLVSLIIYYFVPFKSHFLGTLIPAFRTLLGFVR